MKISPKQNISWSRVVLSVVAVATALVGAFLVAVGLGIMKVSESIFPDPTLAGLVGLMLLAMGLGVLCWLALRPPVPPVNPRALEQITVVLEEWDRRDDALSMRQRVFNLFCVSFVGLFFELALIRWLGAEIRVFAYLKNVVLIAAFLGLGIGFFISHRRAGLLPLFLPLAALLVGGVAVGGALGLWQKVLVPGSDQLVLLGLASRDLQVAPLLLQVIAWVPYYGVTITFFVFVAILFIPLGQYTGKCMRALAPIPGYCLNLLGSLLGTLAFTGVSFAWLPPPVWFALSGLGIVVPLRGAPVSLWRVNLALVLGFIAVLTIPDSTVWSPYNNLMLNPQTATDSAGRQVLQGYRLSIGSYTYQELMDFSPGFFDGHPDLQNPNRGSQYWVPYEFVRPQDVLVLGAGAGNDVAAALRYGARSVDAVDIDPAIISIGQRFHPEQPYQSERVTAIADDARAYVHTTTKRYDLILFGFLDSQQVLSAFGSARLDNFVYTVEGMQEAFSRVRPGGVLGVSFLVFEPWIAERIYGVLETAAGQKPTAVKAANEGTVFLVRKGPAFSEEELTTALKTLGPEASRSDIGEDPVPLTSDDWPFLYLREREMPLAYWSILPILGLVATVMLRRGFVVGARVQWHFFFLGAAFMLMEVRIIGQVALLFGSTWLVNVVAIASILIMAISANLLVAVWKPQSALPAGICLLISLLITSLIPSSVFLNWNQGIGGVAAAIVLALPVFFAGLVFSVYLRRTSAVDTALASNLAGAILGGFSEYLSVIFGIGSLALLAALLYGLALVTGGRRRGGLP